MDRLPTPTTSLEESHRANVIRRARIVAEVVVDVSRSARVPAQLPTKYGHGWNPGSQRALVAVAIKTTSMAVAAPWLVAAELLRIHCRS